MKKVMFWSVLIMLWAWVLASFADIITNNLGDCVYQSWNIFAILWGVA